MIYWHEKIEVYYLATYQLRDHLPTKINVKIHKTFCPILKNIIILYLVYPHSISWKIQQGNFVYPSKLKSIKLHFCRFLHHRLCHQLFGVMFRNLTIFCLTKDDWQGFNTRNGHMVPHCSFYPILKWCLHINRNPCIQTTVLWWVFIAGGP